MKARRYDPVSIPAEAGRRRVHRFVCCGCQTVWDISANTVGGARAVEDIERQAKRHGWRLGRSAGQDLCGACERQSRERGRGEHLRLIPKEEPTMPDPAPKAEAPREMTRVDRRVINAKLEEVYVDESVGYAKGWSDLRVAQDLGVPRAWVETLRDETFGPHGEAEDHRAVREGIASLTQELAKAHAEFAAFKGDFVKRLNALDGRLAEMKTAARAAGIKA